MPDDPTILPPDDWRRERARLRRRIDHCRCVGMCSKCSAAYDRLREIAQAVVTRATS